MPASGPSPRRRWLVLIVLLFGLLMSVVDVFVVNVSLPSIENDLHATGAQLQLVVGGYTISYATLLITGARLGNLFGLRRMYVFGVYGFTVASLACGLAPTVGVLIAFRFAQGTFAAIIVPQIVSVIQLWFTGPARARALSGYSAVLSTGAVVGLVVGGLVVGLDLLGQGWRPVFFMNVPIGLLLTILVPRLLPPDEPAGTRRLDPVGLALAIPAVVLVVVPLVLGREAGWPQWTFICLGTGVLFGVALGPVQLFMARHGRDPLFNPAVLRARGVSRGVLALVSLFTTYGGFLFAFTLYLERGVGLAPLATGLLYLPMTATFGVVGVAWHRLPSSWHRMLAPTGLALCATGYLLVSLAIGETATPGRRLSVALAVLGCGLGLAVSPLLTRTLANVAPSQVPDASGVLTTTTQVGLVLGVAVFGTLFLSGPGSPDSAPALVTTTRWLAALALAGFVVSARPPADPIEVTGGL